jgi:hypothetical protein
LCRAGDRKQVLFYHPDIMLRNGGHDVKRLMITKAWAVPFSNSLALPMTHEYQNARTNDCACDTSPTTGHHLTFNDGVEALLPRCLLGRARWPQRA